MTLVEQYTEISEKLINDDEEIKKYEQNLISRELFVTHLIASSKLTSMMAHPIRLVRTFKENKRLENIEKRYYKIRNSKLTENINWKKAGEFGEDLERAARETKIENIRDFMNKHIVDDKKIDQKLLKLRNKGF